VLAGDLLGLLDAFFDSVTLCFLGRDDALDDARDDLGTEAREDRADLLLCGGESSDVCSSGLLRFLGAFDLLGRLGAGSSSASSVKGSGVLEAVSLTFFSVLDPTERPLGRLGALPPPPPDPLEEGGVVVGPEEGHDTVHIKL